jgi:chemotaxis protein MotA
MMFIIGVVTVFGCVLLGYLMHHGKLSVLWQPNEFIIILGAAIGSFILGNPKDLIIDTLKSFKKLMRGKPHTKENFLELLLFIYNICKVMKTKGMLEVEQAIEKPSESELFTKYPTVLAHHEALEFFCDYIRLITMGMDNHFALEELMEKDIETIEHHGAMASGALSTVGDAMPALGIVAAVLGVIITMGSITEPPEILGGLIGAALVGTFFGVLMSYGIIAPMAGFIGKFCEAEVAYFRVIKAGLLAHTQGNAPVITVEFARKIIAPHERPTFHELDAAINGPQPAAE